MSKCKHKFTSSFICSKCSAMDNAGILAAYYNARTQVELLQAMDLPEFLRSLAAIQAKELHMAAMNKLAKDIDYIFKEDK